MHSIGFSGLKFCQVRISDRFGRLDPWVFIVQLLGELLVTYFSLPALLFVGQPSDWNEARRRLPPRAGRRAHRRVSFCRRAEVWIHVWAFEVRVLCRVWISYWLGRFDPKFLIVEFLDEFLLAHFSLSALLFVGEPSDGNEARPRLPPRAGRRALRRV